MAFQLVERSGPALLVAAASLLVAQARMCEREFGPLDNGAKPDLDKRLPWIFDAARPVPTHAQPFGLHDLEIFAATLMLASIEPFVMNVALIDLFYANEEWAKLRRPGAVEFVQKRLSALSKSLGDKPYLDGDRFTAGDLMMTTVLRILKHTDIVTSEKRLAAYVERCTARPAFKRAFDAQISDFREAA